MLPDEDLSLFVQAKDVRAVVFDSVVVSGGFVILKLSRLFVIANANPLVTGEGTVSSEVTSEVDFLGREVSYKVLHSRLHNGGNLPWNAALVAELGSNDQRLGAVGSHVGDNHVAAFGTTIEHGESGGPSRGSPVVIIVTVGRLLRRRSTPVNAPDVLDRLPSRLSGRIRMLSFKLNGIFIVALIIKSMKNARKAEKEQIVD